MSGITVTSRREDEILDDILAKKDIEIATITGTKRKLKYSKETRKCFQFCSGVGQKVRAETGVVSIVHKS
jgi:hypothetical protein